MRVARTRFVRGALLCVLAWTGLPVHAAQVTGAWRAQQSGDTPAKVLAEAKAGQLRAFDPNHMQLFVNKPRGSWIVLWPDPAATPPQIVSLPWPTLARVSLYDAHGMLRTTDVQHLDSGEPGYGRLALRLPSSRAPGAPILLQLRQSSVFPVPVTLRLQTVSAFQQDNAQWLSMASACFGVMLAMSMLALCFALMLRDATFAWYAGYVISYVLLQAMQSGFLYVPLNLGPVIGDGFALGILSVLGSLVFASFFMLRFCDVGPRLPRLRRLLLYVLAAVIAIMLLRTLPSPTLQGIVQRIVNPLVATWALLVLLIAALSAVRGSRTAWFFLAGWTPLLVLVALANAQGRGQMLPQLDWLHNACIVAAAVESIVLSIGLADRALTMRRERDRARVLADLDALTGLLNRRAWSDAAKVRMATGPARSQVLLFLDLDHFKALNDHFGHAAGDRALLAFARTLKQELRTDDLLGRYGGEEFVALISNIDDNHVMQIAARLCRRVDELGILLDGGGALLTVSIGVARQRPADSVTSLVARADAAMYAAKTSGRNQVVWESGDLSGTTGSRPASVAVTGDPAG